MEPATPSGRVSPLRPGDPRRIGGYELTGLLGEGGMGQVFLGRSRAGRKVAVKLIRPEYVRQATFRERFAREVEAARRVGGFHTVQVVDADPYAEQPWMVTAYIAGPSLQDRVDDEGVLDLRQVARVGAQVAEGLAAIHACGLIHRDLKPSNVVLAADGARIIDFGIARAVDATTLTAAGTMLGTYVYMSPEQVRNAEVTAAGDVFGLGSVLAFAATGAAPFRADTLPGIVHKIINGAPDLTGIPGPLLPLISACLAKDPAQRPSPDEIITRCTALADEPADALAEDPVEEPAAEPVGDPIGEPPPQPLPATRKAPEEPSAGERIGQVTTSPAPPPVETPGPERPQVRPLRRRTLLVAGAAAVAGAVTIPAGLTRGRHDPAAYRSSPTQAPARVTATPEPIHLKLKAGPSATVGHGLDSAVVSPDGRTVVVSTSDTKGTFAWLLDATDLEVKQKATLGYGANQVAFGPGGKSLAYLGFGGNPEALLLWLLDPADLSVIKSIKAPGDPKAYGAAAFSPDRTRLAFTGNDKLSLLDTATLRTIKTVTNPSGGGMNVIFSPGEKTLIIGGKPGSSDYLPAAGSVCLLDAATLNTIKSTKISGDVESYSLALSRDGRTLALVGHGDAGGMVMLLDAATLRTLATTPVPGGAKVTAAAAAGFTPDGTVLAGYSEATDVTVWLLQVATMKTITSATLGPARRVAGTVIDLSADGKTLSVGYSDQRYLLGKICLWKITRN